MATGFETTHMLLTPLSSDDAAEIFAYRVDPQVARYQGFVPGTLADVVDFIESSDASGPVVEDAWRQFGMHLRDSGLLVGDLGFRLLGFRLPAGMPRQAEIGITLAPGHQGRGLAMEALFAVMDYLFGDLGMHRVFASADPRNMRSIALLSRVG